MSDRLTDRVALRRHLLAAEQRIIALNRIACLTASGEAEAGARLELDAMIEARDMMRARLGRQPRDTGA